jgi:hypothetical protein
MIPTAQEFTSTVGWSRPRTVSLVLEALNEKNLMKPTVAQKVKLTRSLANNALVEGRARNYNGCIVLNS